MKLYELNGRLSRFLKGYLIRRLLFAFGVVTVMTCAVLGCFYFQLALNSSMCTLISFGAISVMGIITVITLLLRRSEDYYRTICTAYASRCETKGFVSAKALKSEVLSITKEVIPGISGYKQARRENLELLKAMLTGRQAFNKYSQKGFIGVIVELLLRFVFADFADFAIIDCLGTGHPNNRYYGIESSTRWFKVYESFTKSLLSWLFSKIAPFIAWFVGVKIAIVVLNSFFDFNSSIEWVILIGTLCLLIQLLHPFRRQKQLNTMAVKLVDEKMPASDYSLCLAFANISLIYHNRCVEAGYIQTTNATSPDSQAIASTTGTDLLQ